MNEDTSVKTGSRQIERRILFSEEKPASKVAGVARDRYLKDREAAEVLGVSVKCIQAWRYAGKGPKYCVFERRTIRYRLLTLLEWAAEREISR